MYMNMLQINEAIQDIGPILPLINNLIFEGDNAMTDKQHTRIPEIIQSRRIPITPGDRFSRLVITRELPVKVFPSGKPVRVFECICDCGNVRNILITALRSGVTKSCGCYQKEMTSKAHAGIPKLKARKYKIEDLIQKRFGAWVVLKELPPRPIEKGKERILLCRCDCGKISPVMLSSIVYGTSKSCGCLVEYGKAATTHNLSRHPLYKVWQAIKQRCLNSNDNNYIYYGGRGISVCNEWKDDFKAFYEWAIKAEWQRGLDIDRIENDGDYTPKNCRFTSSSINSQNTRLLSKRNTSGYRGVSWKSNKNKWAASIGFNSEHYYLGYFTTPEAAARAYDAKVIELGSCHPLNFHQESV